MYSIICWKGYIEEETILKSILPVMHFCKIINTFYKDYLENSIAILPPIDFSPPITKLTTKLMAKLMAKLLNAIKRKQVQLAKNFVKQIKEV